MTRKPGIVLIEPELSYKIMGILFNVHKELGGRYQEKYYQRAIAKGLEDEKIQFLKECPIEIEFNKAKIGNYFLDFLIDDKIILEVKAVPFLERADYQQLNSYLRTKNLKLGIIANFRGSKLTYKRVINPEFDKSISCNS
jgi:GxxExxY protein